MKRVNNIEIGFLVRKSKYNLSELNDNIFQLLDFVNDENIEQVEVLFKQYCVHMIKVIKCFEKIGDQNG